MGFFERPDPREARCADPTVAAAVLGAVRRHAAAWIVACSALGAAYCSNLEAGLHGTAKTSGTLAGLALEHPVTVVRDARDVPHVRAEDERDLFFAQGFVEASDRLFQMDFARRYAYGRLAEVLGAKALPIDRELRAVDVRSIVRRQWAALAVRDRAALVAYSAGVNAATAVQPLPVEFRLLLYRPEPWRPQDSLAVCVVASLELADSWHAVFARDAAWRQLGPRGFDREYPLSDRRYDVALDGMPARSSGDPTVVAALAHRRMAGSNAWAAGAARSTGGRALLANDPHLDLTIPGIWYVVDLQAPGLHAAGAAIPGVPGIVLGHDERIAWAATNAQTTTTSVYDAGALAREHWVLERFHVRFAADAFAAYYRTASEFSVPNDNDRRKVALVRWPPYAQKRSPLSTFLALERAQSAEEAVRILAGYAGSPQNFVVEDVAGNVAYHLAGAIPEDPAWGRYVHPARDLRVPLAIVPFERLPAVAPSKTGLIVSANNKMYGTGYPLRLSSDFEPPYRAFRIAELLRARSRYDAAYFERMQMDTLSPIDLEIAHAVVRAVRVDPELAPLAANVAPLARWNGRFDPGSKAATLEHALRFALGDDEPALAALLGRLRSPQGVADASGALRDAIVASGGTWRSWGAAGAQRIEHPLSPLRFGFLDGATLPGEGDEYTIHLQEPGFSQGFRAVWEAGAWDRGGIAIPSGESGEPGSGHYTDLTGAWIAGRLAPLPFSRGAVDRSAAAVLELLP